MRYLILLTALLSAPAFADEYTCDEAGKAKLYKDCLKNRKERWGEDGAAVEKDCKLRSEVFLKGCKQDEKKP